MNSNYTHLGKKEWGKLIQLFKSPEDEDSRATLVQHMGQILFGLQDFLKKNVGVTEEISLLKISKSFQDTVVNEKPENRMAEVITDIIEEIAPQAVNVSSPYFVGHMTSAIPFFMIHLKSIVAALNQNVVKLETSKVVSLIERQVIAKIHRILYDQSESFYKEHVQSITTTLGVFTEGGTAANMTALWVARNTMLKPRNNFEGVEEQGLLEAYKEYNIERSVILVSKRGHYSLRKIGGILGIGSKNVISVDVDSKHRIDLNHLNSTIAELQKKNIGIIAVVGIAGATETGSIDPLKELSSICKKNDIHFHVDAAWGGPTILSSKYRNLLDGIELADSVTIDCHKQFYMPMSCGMVHFKNPDHMKVVEYHAKYIIRPGSVDLGIKSFAGSREANSLILDSSLKILGKDGYSMLIDHGIELAKDFAKEINKRDDFQLITAPVLNILTYRYCPVKIQQKLKKADHDSLKNINEVLNEINISLQRLQREAGNSFVSRTEFCDLRFKDVKNVVLRTVLMNPLTNIEILNNILDEQKNLVKESDELIELYNKLDL
ncbi:MAG: putative pyridoxal-dependent aspartate 1-decarboxylase [Desulfobacterales bacterium]|nr:putative pyridoxal-dependent aspartate 1-decarboxylase [Desulfobacterales bacterium]MCP4164094.1 putative pyridoxal-dependent aspartate 1-decarboxylase [Deltaproteobacteria bacterium]